MGFWERRATHVIVLLAVGAAVFLPLLGQVQHIDGREARHAKIAQTMLQTGLYSVPYVNGRPYIDKPPLFNWVEAFLYWATGHAKDPSFLLARLPSVLCAVVIMLCTYVLGARWLSARAGFLAGLIWTTSWLVMEWGRFSRPDMMLAALILTAIVLTDSAAAAGPGWRRVAFWCGACAVLSAATLSKGPQSLFYWGVATAALWPARAERRLPPLWLVPIGLAIIAAPVTAWLLEAEHVHPGHFRDLTGYQFGKGLVEHPKRIVFYFDQIMVRTMPWGFFVVGAVYWLVRRVRRSGYDSAAVPGVVLAACLIALTILTNKGAHYMLPVLPMWALLLGMFLDRALDCRRKAGPEAPAAPEQLPPWAFEWPLAVSLAALALLATWAAFYFGPRVNYGWEGVIVFLATVAGLGAAGLMALLRKRAVKAFVILCVALALIGAAINPVKSVYGPQEPSEWAQVLSGSGPSPALPTD